MRLLALALQALLAWTALAVLASGTARAGDIEDFQAARALYDAHDWPRAIAAFEALVGGETPSLQIQPLVLESRKYLAAAYVFEGREEAASAQLERLLREEPSYELDPTQFPREVVLLFERVRTRLAEVREMEETRARLEGEVARLRAENAAMAARLSGERVLEVPRSQWLVQIPFGVGQFENGDEGTGYFFLVTEALAALGAVTTTILHLAYVAELTDNGGGVPAGRWALVNQALDIVAPFNWGFLGLFGALAVAGVVEANLSFRPTRRVRLPAEPALSVALRLGPGFLSLSGSF